MEGGGLWWGGSGDTRLGRISYPRNPLYKSCVFVDPPKLLVKFIVGLSFLSNGPFSVCNLLMQLGPKMEVQLCSIL